MAFSKRRLLWLVSESSLSSDTELLCSVPLSRENSLDGICALLVLLSSAPNTSQEAVPGKQIRQRPERDEKPAEPQFLVANSWGERRCAGGVPRGALRWGRSSGAACPAAEPEGCLVQGDARAWSAGKSRWLFWVRPTVCSAQQPVEVVMGVYRSLGGAQRGVSCFLPACRIYTP